MTDLSTTFAAVAFAEEDDKDTARDLLKAGKQAPPPRRRNLGEVVLLGVAVTALYAALFVWQDEILRVSAAGRWNFLWPVAIAFVFSLVHGSFTGKLWTAVGLVAKK